MACCGDVHFKQLAVIDFLTAEEESVTNIYQQLQSAYGVGLLMKARSVIGLHELQVLRKVKWASVTHAALANQ